MKAVIEKIKLITADEFGITVTALSGPTRTEAVAIPRMTAMQIVWRYCGLTNKTIANYFGRRDHASVYHARKRVKEMLETSNGYTKTYEKIWQEIQES